MENAHHQLIVSCRMYLVFYIFLLSGCSCQEYIIAFGKRKKIREDTVVCSKRLCVSGTGYFLCCWTSGALDSLRRNKRRPHFQPCGCPGCTSISLRREFSR
jgi:hypothetical protein